MCRCDHASDRLDQARVIVLDPRWAAAPRRSVWRRSCQTLFGRRLRSRNSGRDCRWATSPEFRQQPAIEFAGDLEAAHRQDHVGVARTRVGFALDSLLEGDGFEPSVPGRETVKPIMGGRTAFSKMRADLLGNRKFESGSLQRGVCCEPPASRIR